MADIASLVQAIGGISALIGMSSASVTQLGAARRQWQPPQQQAQQIRRCNPAPDGTPTTPEIRKLPDGSLQIVCVEHVQ
jgi:hypothetical protein